MTDGMFGVEILMKGRITIGMVSPRTVSATLGDAMDKAFCGFGCKKLGKGKKRMCLGFINWHNRAKSIMANSVVKKSEIFFCG